MRYDIEERAIEEAKYIIKNNATVREAAKKFKVGKSTVHRDVVKMLEKINPELAKAARKVLNINYDEKHIRGGNSTKKMKSRLKEGRINA